MTYALLSQLPGISGFLGTRGSLMVDLVFVAMFAVLPILGYSIWLAKHGKLTQHKRVQVTLAIVLLIAVSAFEVEMRITGWEERAMDSPYWSSAAWDDPVHYSLAVHLCFAIPTAFLWLFVVVRALRRFPRPVVPNEHSKSHRFWAPLASFGMFMTATTGWLFYWLAFAAK